MTTYNVGPNQEFKSIQQAINAIVASLGPNPNFLTENIVIDVWEGVYGGFTIPARSIRGTANYNLTIKAKATAKVKLSGAISSPNAGHGHPYVGIGIGDSNPYIKIEGLEVERFHKGIVLGGGCHNAKLFKNLVHRSTNVGIWVYRSDRCQLSNNTILDFDYGLVTTEVNDIAIIHNDIVNKTNVVGSASPSNQYNVILNSRATNSTDPNGTIVLYNNNIVANGGCLFGYESRALGRLRSNNNNIYNPSGVVGRNTSPNSLINTVQDLSQWQSISQNDANSISVPVPYYIPSQQGNAQYTAIALENYALFEGLGRGLGDLATSNVAGQASVLIPHGVVPNYGDTSELGETIQTNFFYGSTPGMTVIARPNPPSIGAYDANPDPGAFGASIVGAVGVPGSGIEDTNCLSNGYSGNLVLEEKYSQSVDCITPSLVPGFFHIRDAQYYLYSDKVGYFLKDITYTDILLSQELHDKPSSGTEGIKVYIDDDEIPKSSYEIMSNRLRLRHRGLDIDDLNKRIQIVGTAYKWSDDSNGFDYITIRQDTRLIDGSQRYFLEEAPTRGAPIIITDDMVSYSDSPDMLGIEFTLQVDPDSGMTEVIFNKPKNLIQNSQFDYQLNGLPSNWGVNILTGASILNRYVTSDDALQNVVSYGRFTGGSVDATLSGAFDEFVQYSTGLSYTTGSLGSYNLYPVLGNNLIYLSGRSDIDPGIRQRVKVDPEKPYWLSFYAAATKEPGNAGLSISDQVKLQYSFYDIEGTALDVLTGDTWTGQKYLDTTSEYDCVTGQWTRHAIAFSNTNDRVLNKQEPSGVTALNSMIENPIPIPERAYYMDVALHALTGICLDCIQITKGYELERYSRNYLGNELTIEYDTGLSELYEAKDMTLTPIRNRNASGFMYIGAVPARQFDENAGFDTTTLTDWGWATGRVEYLPWARVSGKNKLVRRGVFGETTIYDNEDILIAPEIAYPERVQIVPRVPIAKVCQRSSERYQSASTGSNFSPGVGGTEFTVIVTDNNGNPYAFEWIEAEILDDTNSPLGQSDPGLLGEKQLGYYTQYNTRLVTRLDSAGAATLKWIPPAAETIEREIRNPITEIKEDNANGSTKYYIDEFNYRINEASHGNVYVSSADGTVWTNTGQTTFDDVISPQVYSRTVNDRTSYKGYRLNRTPVEGSVEVFINATGNFPFRTGLSLEDQLNESYDLKLYKSDVPELNEGEYFVDDLRNIIFVQFSSKTNDDSKSIRVKYKQRNTYLLADDNGVINSKRLYLSNELYQDLVANISKANPLSILYDMVVDLNITAIAPSGMSIELAEILDSSNTGGTSVINIRERHYNGFMVGRSIPRRLGL